MATQKPGLPENGEELDTIFYPEDTEEYDPDEDLEEEDDLEEEEEEEEGEETETEEKAETEEEPEEAGTEEKGDDGEQDTASNPKPKPKRSQRSRQRKRQPKKTQDPDPVVSEVEALRQTVNTMRRETLLTQHQVPEDLVDLIPQDYDAAKAFLATEKYGKLVRALRAQAELGKPDEETTKPNPKKPKDRKNRKERRTREELVKDLGSRLLGM